MDSKSPRIGLVSLGCPKALVDSEIIATKLCSEGYTFVPTYEDADLVLVNTCAFINEAVEESIEAINEALKKNGKVVVTGCLGKRADEILKRCPGVLSITGPHAYDDVCGAVREHLPGATVCGQPLPRHGIKLTLGHYAYLKISEGCDHECTFCIIPSLRGRLVSRPLKDIIAEAESLAGSGVREIIVVAQDTGSYGADLSHREEVWGGRSVRAHVTDLADMLGGLGVWVRFHYMYPYSFVQDVVKLMADGRIVPYLDVPFQHASSRVLAAMKRPAQEGRNMDSVNLWREICPEITIRSSFVVGFPGETKTEFEELLRFLEEARLDRVGCFKYSSVKVAGANTLSDPVPDELKEERLARLMELQAEISEDLLRQRIGRTETVLVDETDGKTAMGRTKAEAPDVDGIVFVSDALGTCSGDLIEVEIERAGKHDLWARMTVG